jgi:hypothetical protein
VKLDKLLRDGLVVELWFDPRSECRGERFCCAMSRGRDPECWNGYGRTPEESIRDALGSAPDQTVAAPTG